MGSSRPLDFGHWAAHKLEQLPDSGCVTERRWPSALHLIPRYSRRVGLLPEADWRRILQLLCRLGFKLNIPKRFQKLRGRDDPSSLEHGLTEFRGIWAVN